MPIIKIPGPLALLTTLFSATALLSACAEPESTPAGQDSAEVPKTEAVVEDIPSPPTKPIEVISHSVTEHFFRCTDGEEFSIQFGDQMATLNTASEQFDLRQQPAASGTRYADETVELLSNGDQAIFMLGDQTHDCTLVSSEQQQIPGPEAATANP